MLWESAEINIFRIKKLNLGFQGNFIAYLLIAQGHRALLDGIKRERERRGTALPS